MALDGVVHAPGRAVGLVDSDPAIEHIHGVAEHLAVAEIRHVAVVVDPIRPHHGIQQTQRLARLRRLRRVGYRGLPIEALFERPQGAAGADVVLTKHLLDRDQVIVQQALQLADDGTIVNGVAVTKHRLQTNDVIRFARYSFRIEYIVDADTPSATSRPPRSSPPRASRRSSWRESRRWTRASERRST